MRNNCYATLQVNIVPTLERGNDAEMMILRPQVAVDGNSCLSLSAPTPLQDRNFLPETMA